MSGQNEPLRVGIIGAGIFVRDAHVPSLLKMPELYRIVAVCSRRIEQAQEVVTSLPYPADALDDVDALLARADVDVVDVVLPIDVQPAMVERVLAAGKHVISEKPIAANLAGARSLIETWQPTGLCWMVAENWRYEDAFVLAAQVVRDGLIGRPLLASWTLHLPVNPDVKYYHTLWRRRGDLPGGFLVDGGVHHVAALRCVLGDVESVQAYVEQFSPDLPPADTLAAALRFACGALATYTVTYAVNSAWSCPLIITGTDGSLRVDRGLLDVHSNGVSTAHTPANRSGIDGELIAFHAWVTAGIPCANTPQEALRDLAVIEAMLHSASTGEAVAVALD